jgi:hypothetical protein
MPEDALVALNDLLASRERRIDLSEYFSVVTTEAIGQLTPEAFPMEEQPTEESVRERVERYEGVLTPLLRSLFLGGYYGDLPCHVRIWSRCLKRLVEAAGGQPTGQVFTVWDQMRYYPGLLGLYACATGAIAGGSPDVVARLLSELHFDNELLRSTRAAIELAASLLLPAARPAATSSWLQQRLSGFAEGLVAPDQLIVAFDQFEYSVGLLLADEILGADLDGSLYLQPAGWWYRQSPTAPWSHPAGCMTGPAAKHWLGSGFFAASPERLDEVKERYDVWVAQERMRSRLGYR